MPVLSQKEFKEKKKEEKISQAPVIKSLPKELEKKSSSLNKEYVFLHPDSPPDGRINFKETFTVNEKVVEIECINGIVKTNDETLINYLRERNFYLLEVKEK